MKKLEIFKAAAVMMMVCFSAVSIAQPANYDGIPPVVMASVSKKYPGAKIKKWQIKNGDYTAKAIIGGHKYAITLNKNGDWLSTASIIGWAHALPKVVNTAYRKTSYNTWHIYLEKKVEKPTGEFYQLLVDDSELHIGQNHEPVYTVNKLLEFKADGTLAMIKDITAAPVP